MKSALLAALALSALAGAASAAPVPAVKPNTCFFSRDWAGWRSPDENTIYLRVHIKDIYKIELSSGSPRLIYPDSHLVNVMRGTDSVCSPLDLDLAVSDQSGFPEHLFAKSITKLTPEEIKLIPKKFLP
jgi:hypothetical protein